MGLDLAFNRQEALDAGIETIKEEEDDYDIFGNVIGKRMVTYVSVPGMTNFRTGKFWVQDDGVTDIVVRANKWGRVYSPLTDWLIENNIEWSEF